MLGSGKFLGITLLIAGLFVSFPALAHPCGAVSDPIFGYEIENRAKQEHEDKNSDLVFVFVDEANKNIVAIESVGLSSPRNHVGIDAKVLSHLKKGISFRVYNFSQHGAMVIDRTDDSMKTDFDPAADCSKATRLGRTIRSAPRSSYACDAIDLADVKAASIIYDQTANACEKFARYSGKERTAAQEGELKVAARLITTAFDGPDRRPAIDEDSTQFATGKIQAIGTSKNVTTKRELKHLDPERTSTTSRKAKSSHEAEPLR